MPETIAWKDPSCPVRVEYLPGAFEKIRRLAVDGLLSLPRVGLGVGGLLLGTKQPGKVIILDIAPIACSYATGPSFAPTVDEVGQARKSAPTAVVGCYWSRPRRSVEFTQKDTALFADLCSGAEQIALLIRPSTTDASRAGLFYRKPDGSMAGGMVFPLEEIELPEEPEELASDESATAPPQAEPANIPVSAELFGQPVEQPELFATASLPRKVPWQAMAAPLLVVAILIAMYMTREEWLPRPALDLRTAETNGHFAVEWDRAGVRGVDHAVLTVTDGKTVQKIALNRAQLQAGTIAYERKTTDVTADLDAGSIHASAKFAPPPPPPAPPAPAAEPSHP